MIMEETKLDKQRQQQAYENYVKRKTPVHNLPANMAKAFVTGGAICVIGQAILDVCEKSGLDKDISGGWTSMILVLLSVLLTGFNIYPGIAKWGGAGALVPITGFANSVAAPANTRKKDRSWASAARSLPLQARSSCMGYLPAGYWGLATGY